MDPGSIPGASTKKRGIMELAIPSVLDSDKTYHLRSETMPSKDQMDDFCNKLHLSQTSSTCKHFYVRGTKFIIYPSTSNGDLCLSLVWNASDCGSDLFAVHTYEDMLMFLQCKLSLEELFTKAIKVYEYTPSFHGPQNYLVKDIPGIINLFFGNNSGERWVHRDEDEEYEEDEEED